MRRSAKTKRAGEPDSWKAGGLADNLRPHDLVYERAPLRWLDGLPLANGGIGAVLWGDGAPLIFTLDSYDVWETRTLWPGDDPRFTYANLRRLKEEGRVDELYEVALRRRNTRFTESPPPHPTRLPLGRMEVRWAGTPRTFRARLDLHRARAAGQVTLDRGRAAFSSFICSGCNVLVLDIGCDKSLPLPEIHLRPAPTDDFSRTLLRAWKYPDPDLHREPGRMILFRSYGERGEYSLVAETVCRRRGMTVFLTLVSGKQGEDTRAQACRILAEARKTGVTALRAEHEAEWASFWGKSAIQLPDPRLESLYYMEQYKHHCSSRPGHLPVPIQGLWTTDGAWPPWRGNYTSDMNTQMSYWPVYASNHLEDAEPLYEMYWRNLPYHRKLGMYWYGKPIAIVTSEHGPGGEPFPGLVTDEHCPSSGAWIAHSFWMHWRYSLDRTFLRRRAYPFLKEMIQGYLQILEKRDDGRYHIPFTDSPEFFCGRPDQLGDDNQYDLALLRFLLQSLLEAQPHLPDPDPDAARWRETLANLVDSPLAPTGGFSLYEENCRALPPGSPVDVKDHLCLALRAGEALPLSHRHHSHLIGIYPLGILDPERSEAERRWVDNSLDDLIFKGTGEWSGWSFPWASLIAGRAGKARMAHHYLRLYLDGFLTANTFHTNASDPNDPNGIVTSQGEAMTLEAGFGAAAAILEMLLQSHHGVLRVFPTCYSGWRTAAFFRLRAEGAFLVSARRTAGRVRFVEILSEAGGLCRLRNPFSGDGLLKDLSSGRTRRLRGALLEFRTRRGGAYLLTGEDSAVTERERRLLPMRRARRDLNPFGLKQDASD